jgi:hypothetical protein
MRAGKFRGSRTRSPNWPNELNEKVIRQKARQCRAFFFWFYFGNAPCTTCNARQNLLRAIILLPYVGRRTYQVGDGRDENDAV